MVLVYSLTSFSCTIDICLQIDLVLTLKRPFSNPKWRQIVGISVSTFVALIFAIVIIGTEYNPSSRLLQALFIGSRVIFYLSALTSLSVALHAYRTSGLSKQFRKLLMKRHISFCMLTMVCQSVQLIEFLHTSLNVALPGWLEAFCIYYFVFSSVFYSLLRLSEPVVLAAFKLSFNKILCCSNPGRADRSQARFSYASLTVSESTLETRESNMTRNANEFDRTRSIDDSDELSDTLSAFLTSSLNVELVYTILKGIRRIVKTPDLEAWKNGQVPSNFTNDFSMRLSLNYIKIRKFKLWEDAH